MGIEDRVRRKFMEIEEDAKRQHEQKVKNFLESHAKAKRIAEKARIVETLKQLEKVISRERGIKETQVWWTDKAITHKQGIVGVQGIGYLEVTPGKSKGWVSSIPGYFNGEDGLFFRAGLTWFMDKHGQSRIGACVDKSDNVLVWPSTRWSQDSMSTISSSEWGKSTKILEDALIYSLTLAARGLILKNN